MVHGSQALLHVSLPHGPRGSAARGLDQSQQPARLSLPRVGADEPHASGRAVELRHGPASHHDSHEGQARPVAVAGAVPQGAEEAAQGAEGVAASVTQDDKKPRRSVRFLAIKPFDKHTQSVII